MNFKFIYEGISNKITFSVLTIVQFTIGIVCIYMTLGMINSSSSAISRMNKYFGEESYYSLDSSNSNIDLSSLNGDILKDIKRHFDDNERIEFLSANSTVTLMKEKDSMQDALVTVEPVEFEKSNYMRSQSYQINKKFVEKMNYKFLKGGTSDFNTKNRNEHIPVILGYIYKDKYDLGDIIERISWSDEGQFKKGTMEVVGILDTNNYICEKGMIDNITTLNNSILFPFDEDNMLKYGGEKDSEMIRRVDLYNYITKGYIILQDGETVENLNSQLKNFEYKFSLKDLNKTINEYKDQNINSIKPVLSIATIIIIFTMISIVVVMINTILTDKKEFGINILLGATMKNIKIRIIGQVLVLLCISIILATIVLLNIKFISFNIVILGATVCVMAILMLVMCMIIVSYLKKYSVSDLVRRNE